jgi:hypothetical protein
MITIPFYYITFIKIALQIFKNLFSSAACTHLIVSGGNKYKSLITNAAHKCGCGCIKSKEVGSYLSWNEYKFACQPFSLA